MFQKPEIMALAGALSSHAALRQSVVAENVANADTPGYRARGVRDFAEVFGNDQGTDQRRTRPGHFGTTTDTQAPRIAERPGQGHLSPNGNSVSLEAEMVEAAGIRRDHDQALAIYRTSIDVLRASLGRR